MVAVPQGRGTLSSERFERPARLGPNLWPSPRPSTPGAYLLDAYPACMSFSPDGLRALGARVRAEAEAAGELAASGSNRWDIPREAREALLEYGYSGAYEEAARACIVDEPAL